MQDELFQRQWNAHHDLLTAGLTKAPGHSEANGPVTSLPIGRTYDETIEENDPPIQVGARVIAAGVATALLWVTVISFATTLGTPFLA